MERRQAGEIEDLIAGVGRHKEPLEFPSPLGRDVYLPLLVGGKTTGALIARGTEASMPALVSAARLVNLAVERERFIEENAHIEALRESETLKTSLLRAISHDLTTPLTAITLHTEALRRSAENNEEMKGPVAGIAGETSRLRRRIDNLLAMARLEAGKSKPRREPTPPADLFHAVRENLPLVFESRPVSIHVEDDCPDANVDPALALEILVNLIENAHRVSPPDAPLELTARIHPLDSAQVRIEVLDRGPGVPAGIADRVTAHARGPTVSDFRTRIECPRKTLCGPDTRPYRSHSRRCCRGTHRPRSWTLLRDRLIADEVASALGHSRTLHIPILCRPRRSYMKSRRVRSGK